MTRLRIPGFSLAAMLLLAAFSQAEAQTNLKIAFVNMDSLIRNAPQTQDVNKKLNDEFKPRDAEIKTLQQSYQEKADNLQRNAAVMSADEANDLRSELTKLQRELQRRQNDLQEDFEYRQNELVNQLQQTLIGKVQTWAEGQGYDLVVTGVIYASKSIDVTDAALKAISADAGTSGSATK
jgi:outer membrane protein